MKQQMMTLPTTIFGRTGLKVTRLGLGCGGPSRLGLKQNATRDDAVAVIRHALDRGINFLDTAEAYTTEPEVARAVRESGRDDVVVCTKTSCHAPGERAKLLTGAEFRVKVEERLTRLETDCLDILLLHGVEEHYYEYARSVFLPVLMKMRHEGKLRWLGFSEEFNTDTRHKGVAAARAKDDDGWDVVMLGFNLLNQTARQSVLPWTMKHNIGTVCMYAVRRAISQPQRLAEVICKLIDRGEVDAGEIDRADPLGFLVRDGAAASATEAGYRYAMHEPGLDVILTGTGNIAHLDQNVEAALAGPLPQEITTKLHHLFGKVQSIAGN